MEITFNQIQKTKSIMTKLMAEFTGKKEKEVFDAMERDNWMSAMQAKDFGLIDNILEKRN